jgi:hypothetical protein
LSFCCGVATSDCLLSRAQLHAVIAVEPAATAVPAPDLAHMCEFCLQRQSTQQVSQAVDASQSWYSRKEDTRCCLDHVIEAIRNETVGLCVVGGVHPGGTCTTAGTTGAAPLIRHGRYSAPVMRSSFCAQCKLPA